MALTIQLNIASTNKARRFSTAHENVVGVEKVESAIAHFHTNGLKRYKLLIILNKFRVGIDHNPQVRGSSP